MELFRFQPINKLTLQNLTNQKNWIADPYSFNDPFEFSLYDSLLYDETGKIKFLTPEEILNVQKFKETIKTFGVVCYSSSYSKNLLWAHYADNHKGMCLVFNISPLNLESIHKVKYQQRFPEINLTDDANTRDEIRSIVTTKSIEWNYEDEYREVFTSKNLYHDYPGKLVEIIFGCRTPFEDIKMVANIAVSKNPDVIISKMTMNASQYGLGKMSIGENTNIPNTWKEIDFKL